MENQHRKISGYRELNQTEIDLMNEVKALGVVMENLLVKVAAHVAPQHHEGSDQTNNRLANATPERFLELAKTEFQTGLMYATRAVAQPEFF